MSVLFLFSLQRVSGAAELSASVSSGTAVEKIVYWRCLPLAPPSVVLRIAFLVLKFFLFGDLLEELSLVYLRVCCFIILLCGRSNNSLIIFLCSKWVKNIF